MGSTRNESTLTMYYNNQICLQLIMIPVINVCGACAFCVCQAINEHLNKAVQLVCIIQGESQSAISWQN